MLLQWIVHVCDAWLPPPCKCYLRSSGMLWGGYW
jgi:hypothetical protein